MSRESSVEILKNLVAGKPIADLQGQIRKNVKGLVACLEDDDLLDELEVREASPESSQIAEFFTLLSDLTSKGRSFKLEEHQLTEYERSLEGVGLAFSDVLCGLHGTDVILHPLRSLGSAEPRVVDLAMERPDVRAAGEAGSTLAKWGLAPGMLLSAARATALYLQRERLIGDEGDGSIWISKDQGLIPAELKERRSISHWDVLEELRAYSKCPVKTKLAVHKWTAATAKRAPFLFPGFVAEEVMEECIVTPTVCTFDSLASRLVVTEQGDEELAWNAKDLIRKFLKQRGIQGSKVKPDH